MSKGQNKNGGGSAGRGSSATLEEQADAILESQGRLEDLEKQIERRKSELAELAELSLQGLELDESVDPGTGPLEELISEFALPEKAFAILLLGQMEMGLKLQDCQGKILEYLGLREDRVRHGVARALHQYLGELASRAVLLSQKVPQRF